MNKTFYIPNELKQLTFGGDLARYCLPGAIIFLQGDLGAGKTTLVRGFLQGLGYSGLVKSPTYTLVESYNVVLPRNQQNVSLHHFDFYRIKDFHELENIGLRDFFNENAICVIEWPENAMKFLPEPMLCCKIQPLQNREGREIILSSRNETGQAWIRSLKK